MSDRRYVAAQKPPDSPESQNARDDYNVRQMLQVAMRALRDCEDYMRLTQGNQLGADRVRAVHEALSEDVINGRSYLPSREEMTERVMSVYKEVEAHSAESADYEACRLLLWNIL